MGLREWGLAAALLLGSCATKENTETKLEQKIDHYSHGLELEQRAEQETNELERYDLLKEALHLFQQAEKSKPTDSILKQIYCHSQLGQMLKAFELADKSIEKNPKEGLYAKGILCQQQGWHAMAIGAFTKSIEINDDPKTRLARYNSYMAFSTENNTFIIEGIEAALKDIKKYVESNKEEPDAHVYHYKTLSMLSFLKQDKEKKDEAYRALSTAIELIDSDKPLKNKKLQEQQETIRSLYNSMTEEHEKQKQEKAKKSL